MCTQDVQHNTRRAAREFVHVYAGAGCMPSAHHPAEDPAEGRAAHRLAHSQPATHLSFHRVRAPFLVLVLACGYTEATRGDCLRFGQRSHVRLLAGLYCTHNVQGGPRRLLSELAECHVVWRKGHGSDTSKGTVNNKPTPSYGPVYLTTFTPTMFSSVQFSTLVQHRHPGRSAVWHSGRILAVFYAPFSSFVHYIIRVKL